MELFIHSGSIKSIEIQNITFRLETFIERERLTNEELKNIFNYGTYFNPKFVCDYWLIIIALI